MDFESLQPGVEAGDDAAVGKKAELPGTPTPERPESVGSPGSPVSDDTCPICLGHITDRCVADSCLHGFCLVCLKEWAKQKPVCPLCKLTFTKIMYEIKSETEYKEWKVPRPDPAAERSARVANFQEFLDAERRRFFGYRTTNFPGAATLRRLYPNQLSLPDAIPSGPRERRPTRYNLRGSSMFRLSVYLNNVWVQPIADITGRYRRTSPELYREQPALTHRLVPWINRELAALLPSSRIGAVLTEVMDLIERHPISSREFRRSMQVHLGRRTNHFVHEFYHFARSPYDMVGHDNAAHYLPRYGFNDDDSSSSSSSSDDSDAIVEVDAQGNRVDSTSRVANPSATLNDVAREETLTHEGSVVISSEDSTTCEDEDQPTTSQGLSPNTHNPEPPRNNKMKRLVNRAKTFLSTVNEGASTSRSAAASGANSVKGLKTEAPESDDSDAIVIVDELRPKKERTPELINLDSDEESAEPSTSSKENHWKKKLTEEFSENSKPRGNKKKKETSKKRPVLKRTNFSVSRSEGDADSQPNSTGTSAKQQDHSYCTEDVSEYSEETSSSSSSNSTKAAQNDTINRRVSGGPSSSHYNSVEVALNAIFNAREQVREYYDDDHCSAANVSTNKKRGTCIYSSTSDDTPERPSSTNQRDHHRPRDSETQIRKRRRSGESGGRSQSSQDRKDPSAKRVKKDVRSKVKSSLKASNRNVASHHPTHDSTPASSTHSCEHSDIPWSPSSSRARISRQESSESSNSESKDSDWRDDKYVSKPKSSKSAKKKKKKRKHKHEKDRKHKKTKRKKKSKSKKSWHSSSSGSDSTDSEDDYAKRKRGKGSSSYSSDSLSYRRFRKRSKLLSSTDSMSDSD